MKAGKRTGPSKAEIAQQTADAHVQLEAARSLVELARFVGDIPRCIADAEGRVCAWDIHNKMPAYRALGRLSGSLSHRVYLVCELPLSNSEERAEGSCTAKSGRP